MTYFFWLLGLLFVIEVTHGNCPVYTKTTTGMTGTVVGTLTSVGINRCLKECKMRMRCNGVAYDEVQETCKFYERATTGTTAAMYSWKRADIMVGYNPCGDFLCSARSKCVLSSFDNKTHCIDDGMTSYVYYNLPFRMRNRGSMFCHTSTSLVDCNAADTEQEFQFVSSPCTNPNITCAQIKHINTGHCLLYNNNSPSFGACSTADEDLWTTASSTQLHGTTYLMNRLAGQCLHGNNCGQTGLCITSCSPHVEDDQWDIFFT